MTEMLAHGRQVSPRFCSRFFRLAGMLALGLAPFTGTAKFAWPPVPAEELAESKPKIEPDAPAEVLEWKIETDDRDFPHTRDIVQYVRFKIYAPEKATQVTRISGIDSSDSIDDFEVRARLTLPNGRVQEFGQEAVKERTLVRHGNSGGFLGWLANSGAEVKEKFLAVPGIEPGAILEYRISQTIRRLFTISYFQLQKESIPIRHVEFTFRPTRSLHDWSLNTFVLHKMNGVLNNDQKTRLVTFTASNVPSIVPEPFIGPFTDYKMTMLISYQPTNTFVVTRSSTPDPAPVEPKLGHWAGYATIANWLERDRAHATPRIKKLAAEITASAKDDTGKAVAIHDYVLKLFQEEKHRPHSTATKRAPESLDDFLEFTKEPNVNRTPEEFLWLALALYQSAGFEAHLVMLPDRRIMRFNEEYVSRAFLPNEAIAVRLGGEWHFSTPGNEQPLPFGLLPWRQEGQVGLLALDHRQEFIPVPATPAAQSVVTTTGTFSVDLGGTLVGDCQRTFTGQTAVALRALLQRAAPAARVRLARTRLGLDSKVAAISAVKVEGIENAEEALVISAHVRWPGFAARTKERLVVRPNVFRLQAAAPFSAGERHYPICFPYHWTEVDHLTVSFPEGFAPEAPSEPAPLDAKVMSHQLHLAYDRAHRTLHLTREFKSEVRDVTTQSYPALKTWYDEVARSDQHEVVFLGHDVPMPDTASEAAADENEASPRADAESEEPAENRNDSMSGDDNANN